MPSHGSANANIHIRLQARLPWVYRHVDCAAVFEVHTLDDDAYEKGIRSWQDVNGVRFVKCPACGDTIPVSALRRYLLVEAKE